MDPLAPFERNEQCWCGSGRKYKGCHGAIRSRSEPGEPVPNDTDDEWFIAPHTRLKKDAIRLADDGVPLRMPTGKPEARPVEVPAIVRLLSAAQESVPPLSAKQIGQQRYEIFEHAHAVREAGPERLDGEAIDRLRFGVASLAVSTLHALRRASAAPEPPVVLWNDELSPTELLGRTMLWADHVLVPDELFAEIANDGTPSSIERAVAQQLTIRPLVEAGFVLPVPVDLAAIELQFCG